jgi:hypothetical protein
MKKIINTILFIALFIGTFGIGIMFLIVFDYFDVNRFLND